MTRTLAQMLKGVGPKRRKKIERRAAQLAAEEMSLRELRRAHKLTQERIGETLGIGQDQVSRLEQRSDLLISTLGSYVEMSLRELRRAHKLTQERIGETLGIGQDQVSRLEQRSDLLISTLRSYVEAMGGRLTIIAKFPHQRPVVVSGIAALDPDLRLDASVD